MPERSLKGWFKLAFHLFVSEQWDKVREVVEDNDATYRWLKEQILREIRIVEEKAFRSFFGSAALNIRDRLITLKHVSPDEETFNKVKFWLKQQTGKFTLEDSDNSTEDRVAGCKIALLEASFLYFNEPQEVAKYFRSLLSKLRGVGGVVYAIQAKDNPTILAQVKIINDAAKEYVLSLGQELGDWPNFDIPSGALPTDKADYEPPEIWCLGDYGMADGQMSYPEKVAIDKEGQFLVLEEHTIGMGGVETIQRIQLFSPKGKFLRCVLKRGQGKVNGMADFCLTKDGNIVVADGDEEGKGRIQICDYEGNKLLQIISEGEAPDIAPRFKSVAVDPDGKIIAGDIAAMPCVCMCFPPTGKPSANSESWVEEKASSRPSATWLVTSLEKSTYLIQCLKESKCLTVMEISCPCLVPVALTCAIWCLTLQKARCTAPTTRITRSECTPWLANR